MDTIVATHPIVDYGKRVTEIYMLQAEPFILMIPVIKVN